MSKWLLFGLLIVIGLVEIFDFGMISCIVLGFCAGALIRHLEADWTKRKKSDGYIKDETPKDL